MSLNSGGLVVGDLNLDDTTGSWRFNGGEIQDSTIRTSGSARLFATQSGPSRLRRVTLEGFLDLSGQAAAVEINGRFTLNTTLNVGNAAGTVTGALAFRNTPTNGPTITGTGTIVLGPNTNNTFGGNGQSPNVSVGEGITTISRGGTFGSMGLFINRGTLIVDTAGVVNFGNNNQVFTNLGTVRVQGGGTFAIRPSGSITNLNGSASGGFFNATLNGGKWEVATGSSLRLIQNNSSVNPVRITRLNAGLTLDGTGSRIFGSAIGATTEQYNAIQDMLNIDAAGHLTVTGGRNLIVYGALTNAGSVTVGPGSKIEQSDGLVARWAADGNVNDVTGRHPGTASPSVTYVPVWACKDRRSFSKGHSPTTS